MARRRSAPSPRPRPASRAASPTRAASTQARPSFTPPSSPPPPATRAGAPPPAHPSGSGGMMSGLAGTVMQGMALGTGSAMAHRAVDAVMGSRHPEPAAAQAAAQEIVREQQPCTDQAKAFADCMSYYSGDMGACQAYFEAMQSCRLSLPSQ